MSQATDSVALREPAHQVSPRAVTYWRVSALIGAAVEWVIAVAVYVFALPAVFDAPDRPWWTTVILVAALVGPLVHLLVMPPLRYGIHRWEITPAAIHTRSGWLSIDSRVAPLSRVQTVDSTQGALMRVFKLASLTVTTASAAGPITIDCLDREVARQLVQELTEITGASEGDAT
ncbi:PH domain-containing protein [Nocardioides sp.]|uniref:PH domain-containing protein n=1 Tax=Nocardioides sp. TaxID=35761 RepID=UPI00286DD79C|nr:PH domain-containing protein [Nocardioides sp.]